MSTDLSSYDEPPAGYTDYEQRVLEMLDEKLMAEVRKRLDIADFVGEAAQSLNWTEEPLENAAVAAVIDRIEVALR